MGIGNPLVDSGFQEPPFGAQSEGGNLAPFGQPVNSALVASQIVGHLVQRHHGFGSYSLPIQGKFSFSHALARAGAAHHRRILIFVRVRLAGRAFAVK